MKCSDVEERLTAYLEHFLQNEENGLIERHCAECSRCRGALEDLKRTREMLEKLDELEPPPWLADTVMARIAGKEERKGWLQRFFLPLHVKVPVQALAMALVVVISVYLYRSTTPEPGDIARLQTPAQVSQKLDAPAKKEGDAQKKAEQAPRPDAQRTERKKAGARKTPVEAVPAVPEKVPAAPMGGASVNEADVSRTPPVLAKKDSLSGHTMTQAAPPRPAPAPERAERFKTRGATPMAVREDKTAEYRTAAPGMPRETPWQIVVTSADPSDVVRKARRILISLCAKEVRERTENGSVIVSGLIDPQQVSELENKIAGIAMVNEVRTGTGETLPKPVEIIISREPSSP